MKRVFVLFAVFFLMAACAAAEGQVFTMEQTAGSHAGGPDGDLLYTYLLRQAGTAGGPRRASAASSAGSRLTGTERQIYDILKAGIADVAAGRRTSTVFKILPEDLGLEGRMWTAEELGVSELVSGEDLSSEAKEALNKKLYDLNRLTDALLSDCPYELYWHDKTAVDAVGVSTGYTVSGSGGVYTEIGLTDITFTYKVADEYTYGGNPAETDAGKIGSAQTAAATARAIVNRYAGADRTDFEKLTAYKDEICALTDYNDSAAGNDTTPYGNPWQLVWVFDGDEDTRVVCEGYSKAFQFLCDLSSFNSGSVECYSVTGVMSGATGEGRHMWNVVTMDDGKSYLADVTNCDGGSVGEPDQLFLKGVTFVSSYVQFRREIPGQSTVSYAYSDDTLALWPEHMLTVSTEDYYPASPAETVVAIGIAVPPAKTAYTHGEHFDPAGMTVNRVFGDGHTEPAEDFEISYQADGQTALRKGDTAVTVSASGFTAEQPVTVSAGTLTLEGLTALPREYRPGDTAVALQGGTLTGVRNGDEVTVQIPATASVGTADAGEDKPVTLPEIALTGAQADCYILTLPALTVTIRPASLSGAEMVWSGGILSVSLNGAVLEETRDYTAAGGVYADAQHLKMVITAAEGGNYTGTAELLYAPQLPEVPAEETAVLPADTLQLSANAFAGTPFAAVDLSSTRCTGIGPKAFAGCGRLKLVRLPEAEVQSATDAFEGCSEGLILLVPEGAAFTVAGGADPYGWAQEHRLFVLTD